MVAAEAEAGNKRLAAATPMMIVLSLFFIVMVFYEVVYEVF
jgi:hypothetical protein